MQPTPNNQNNGNFCLYDLDQIQKNVIEKHIPKKADTSMEK